MPLDRSMGTGMLFMVWGALDELYWGGCGLLEWCGVGVILNGPQKLLVLDHSDGVTASACGETAL